MAEEEKLTRWQKYKDKMYANNEKYHAKFQQVKFYCEPELYEAAKSYCEEHGESLTGFIKRLMRSEIGL